MGSAAVLSRSQIEIKLRMVSLHIRKLGTRDYVEIWDAMRGFTAQRDRHTTDECWLVEHPPVFTLGRRNAGEGLSTNSTIPVVHSDRGGLITYHGYGQIVLYWLCDLRRLRLSPRRLVTHLEYCVIKLLANFGQKAVARQDAPGVYVGNRKIASLGLRISRGYSYHGLALNVDGNLAPFSTIIPCGLSGIVMTSLRDLGIGLDLWQAGDLLVNFLVRDLYIGNSLSDIQT